MPAAVSLPIHDLPDPLALSDADLVVLDQPNPTPPDWLTTKCNLPTLKAKIVPTDLSSFTNSPGYTTIAAVSALPVSTFANDAGYVTALTPVSTFPNDALYTTLAAVSGLPISTFSNDLGYTTMSAVSALPISTFSNDVGYITLASLSGLPVSTFTNDSGYLVLGDLNAVGNATFPNNAGYITQCTTDDLLCDLTGGSALPNHLAEVIDGARPSSAPIALADALWGNITSITLTPGSWDVEGVVWFQTTASNFVQLTGGITLVSGTQPTDEFFSAFISNDGVVIHQAASQFRVPIRRIDVAANTIVYLIGYPLIGGGTIDAAGYISARRVR